MRFFLLLFVYMPQLSAYAAAAVGAGATLGAAMRIPNCQKATADEGRKKEEAEAKCERDDKQTTTKLPSLNFK